LLALVTGATGFIGSHLCQGLLEAGWRVRAFHRPSSSLAALAWLEVEHALGDVTQPETLRKAMQGVEVVFHAAAMLGRPRRPEAMYAVTVGGTRHVLAAAAEVGVRRVVQTSSVAALGPPVELPGAGKPARTQSTNQAGTAKVVDEPIRVPPGAGGIGDARQIPLIDENHTWSYRPEWWRYGHAKYLAELEVQRAVACGLDAVLVNPAVVLGPGDLNRVSGDIIVKVAQKKVPAAIAGGLNVIHIADVVRGHLAALERGRAGERYILGGENLTIPHFLRLAAEAAGAPAPRLVLPPRLVRPLAGPAILLGRALPLPASGEILRQAGFYFWYDTLKAQGELGLTGLRTAQEAIRETLEWYHQRGDLA
jgi:dihydroflavonol-4-reductase